MCTKPKNIAMVVLTLILFVFPAVASAQDAAPQNVCTSAVASPSGIAYHYRVDAYGTGQYARIVRVSDGFVIVSTAFPSGTTHYVWPAVPLDQGSQYRVQTSHTSATSGFNNDPRCNFMPPVPQGVEIEDFYVRDGVATVIVNHEANLRYYQLFAGTQTAQPILVTTWAPSHPNGGAYNIAALPQASRAQWYRLHVVDVYGQSADFGPVPATWTARTPDAPTVITLSAVCDLEREQVTLTWSADTVSGNWTVIRNEVPIGTVSTQYPAADVVYTYRDPGAGGEYIVKDDSDSAIVTINCASLGPTAK